MNLHRATSERVRFVHTELTTARAFLDIAETSLEESALYRNVHNAEMAISAVRRALAAGDLDPAYAAEIRRAANVLEGQLTRLTAR